MQDAHGHRGKQEQGDQRCQPDHREHAARRVKPHDGGEIARRPAHPVDGQGQRELGGRQLRLLAATGGLAQAAEHRLALSDGESRDKIDNNSRLFADCVPICPGREVAITDPDHDAVHLRTFMHCLISTWLISARPPHEAFIRRKINATSCHLGVKWKSCPACQLMAVSDLGDSWGG